MAIKSVTYSVKHHPNMGAYEFVELQWSATAESTGNESYEDLVEEARTTVEEAMLDDLDRVRDTTAADDTYVDAWLDGPTRRSSRDRKSRSR